MDFDAGEQPCQLHDETRRKPDAHSPQRVRDAISRHDLKAWIQKDSSQLAAGGGVALQNGVQVAVQFCEHDTCLHCNGYAPAGQDDAQQPVRPNSLLID